MNNTTPIRRSVNNDEMNISSSSASSSVGVRRSSLGRSNSRTIQPPDNLRSSLHHGFGMSLINVNSHPTNNHATKFITPDIPESQRGLFTSGINYLGNQQTKQQKLEEEKFRAQVREFAMRVIFNFPLLLAIISYVGVTAIVVHVPAIRDSDFMEWLKDSHSGMAFFSAFVGFILVFRTQICYNRWWEGRCLWGTLIFAAINLAQQGQGSFTEKENFRRLCCLCVCFAFACKNQLYGESIESDGDYLLSRGLISTSEYQNVLQRQGWQPYYFLGALREIIDIDLRTSGQRAKSNTNVYSFKGSTTDAQLLMMDMALSQMANNIGDLIRVKATGLPLGYDSIFYFIFLVYFIVTTLSWAPLLQWYTPILMGLLHLVVRCITELGTCLEDPFGNDITDLPLDNFCQAIEMQIAAVFADTFPPQPTYVGAWPTHKLPIVKKTVSKDYTMNKDYTLNSTTPVPSSAATRHFNNSSNNSSTSIPQRSAMNISSATEPITTSDDNSPIEECFEDNISSGQLATILSGDCLSGSISTSGEEQV